MDGGLLSEVGESQLCSSGMDVEFRRVDDEISLTTARRFDRFFLGRVLGRVEGISTTEEC